MWENKKNIKFEFVMFEAIFNNLFHIIPKIKLSFALSHLCLINKTLKY